MSVHIPDLKPKKKPHVNRNMKSFYFLENLYTAHNEFSWIDTDEFRTNEKSLIFSLQKIYGTKCIPIYVIEKIHMTFFFLSLKVISLVFRCRTIVLKMQLCHFSSRVFTGHKMQWPWGNALRYFTYTLYLNQKYVYYIGVYIFIDDAPIWQKFNAFLNSNNVSISLCLNI